jgi:hypothetical protein
MPDIKDFGAFKVFSYYEGCNPQYVHLIGPDFAAKMRVSDQAVISGDIPARAKNQAADYVACNSTKIMAQWADISG